jgi:PAS domain S-box-containing protein
MLHRLGEPAQRGSLGGSDPSSPSAATIALAVAIGGIYFLAARLGLALVTESEGVAVFWPASGVAAGALIALGQRARAPIAVGVVGATVAANLLGDRGPWVALAFGLCNAGEAILTGWLIDRWFGRPFRLDDLQRVFGFLAAAGLAAAVAGVAAALAMRLLHASAPLFDIWRVWAVADGLGIIVVAPLLIGLHQLASERVARRDLIEGAGALAALGVMSAIVYSAPPGSWAAYVPPAALFPVLLWVTGRCAPPVAAAAAFIMCSALVYSTTFGVGRLGDPVVPGSLRVPGAQATMLVMVLCVLVLSALFAERRRSEAQLMESKERLQLALTGADLGVWSVDLATGAFDSDERHRRINGHHPLEPPRTLAEARAFVIPEDLPCLDAAFTTARQTVGPCRAEYRVRGSSDAADPRWVAVEGTVVRNAAGRPVRLLGVTRDITERKEAELALAERNAQLALAGQAGLVGSYACDNTTGMKQISAGYAAIYGLPVGTERMTRQDWRARVHPDDRDELEASRERAFALRQREHRAEFRIVRSDGDIRWIESRGLISYDETGLARRMVGVNIDVTERKQAEEHKSMLLAELDHRVKNVLAVVAAVASRTLQTSGSMADFAGALDGRIKSMAMTHELLSCRKWQGIPLAELVERELAPYASGNNVRIEGPQIVLKAEAGQALAMVVHELATNAAKYGALSTREGCVAVRWQRLPANGWGGVLALDWQETGGPAVVSPTRAGYGASVIRDLIPYELEGTVDLKLVREGVRCRLEIPATWLSIGDRLLDFLNGPVAAKEHRLQ